MKLSTTLFTVGAIGLMSACMQDNAGATDAELSAKVAGKTAVSQANGNKILLNADGSMGGVDIAGRWEIKNGKWCRELTAQGREFPYECQGLAITGDQMAITRADGSVGMFTLQ